MVFARSFTVGPWAVERRANLYQDVHLMTLSPWTAAQACVKSGEHTASLQAERYSSASYAKLAVSRPCPLSAVLMPVIRGLVYARQRLWINHYPYSRRR